jgi:chorismate-pyruvate lyase
VELQVTISGASSTVQVLLDGSTVNALTRTLDLGTTPIGRLILGDNSNNRTFQVAYDEVFAA